MAVPVVIALSAWILCARVDAHAVEGSMNFRSRQGASDLSRSSQPADVIMSKVVEELANSYANSGSCHTAVPGDDCYKDVKWAMEHGIYDHPEWYHGLHPASSPMEFQLHVHEAKPERCPAPCLATSPTVPPPVSPTTLPSSNLSQDFWHRGWHIGLASVAFSVYVGVKLAFGKRSWQDNVASNLLGFIIFTDFLLVISNGWWGTWLFIVSYGVLYSVLFFKYETKQPERLYADRYLCCWKDLYMGRAFLPYAIIFSPFLFVFHASRIYLGQCIQIYLERIFWYFFAGWFGYFEDDEFPPNETSLGNVEGDTARGAGGRSNYSEVIWVRAGDFSRENIDNRSPTPKLHDSGMNLFQGKIEATDVRQGSLGDCWLLSAMACLAEHPGAINAIFLTKELNPRGKYQVRLFDVEEDRWKVVTVDDYVPCKRATSAYAAADHVLRSCEDGMPQALFAKPNAREIWALILEKAVAKLCGSYAALDGGFTEWGVVCLTGQKAWWYDSEVKGCTYSFKRWNLKCLKGVKVDLKYTEEERKESEFFDILQYYHRNGAVLCCSGVRHGGESKDLVGKHAYSILRVTQCTKNFQSNETLRFVLLRNPWGDGEWKGDWSDASGMWKEYPYVREHLQFSKSNDGAFWMEWGDFCKYWAKVGVIDNKISINSLHLPPYDTTRPEGPMIGCFGGCLDFWCRCQGPLRLFLNHQPTEEQVSVEKARDKVGCDPSGFYFRLFDK